MSNPMTELIAVNKVEDVFAPYSDTPIEQLVLYHNLNAPFRQHSRAELLIGMCMDNRKQLRLPENFAYILRSGGGNLRYSEFKISFAVAIGGVQAIALIGHTQCNMVNLKAKKKDFVAGLVQNAGWPKEQAEEHFEQMSPLFEIGNEVEFVLSEAARLRQRYPKVLIAPLMYKVEDNKLYLMRE
jgi:carbonic anhydrase